MDMLIIIQKQIWPLTEKASQGPWKVSSCLEDWKWMILAHGNHPPSVLLPPSSSLSLTLLLGWSCKNTHPITSFSLLNIPVSLREKRNLLTKHCKFPQYWANQHSRPHLLTLQAFIASPCTFLRTWLALDLHAVVRVLPFPGAQLPTFPACQNHAHIEDSAQIPLPIYNPFQSRQVLMSPSPVVWIIPFTLAAAMFWWGRGRRCTVKETKMCMLYRWKHFPHGLPGSRQDSLRTVPQLNVSVPEFWPWSVGCLPLAESHWLNQIIEKYERLVNKSEC